MSSVSFGLGRVEIYPAKDSNVRRTGFDSRSEKVWEFYTLAISACDIGAFIVLVIFAFVLGGSAVV